MNVLVNRNSEYEYCKLQSLERLHVSVETLKQINSCV